MAGSLLDRIRSKMHGETSRSSIDSWLTDYLLPANQMLFGNHTYGFGSAAANGLVTTYGLTRKAAELADTLPSYMAALRSCPPAYGAELVRALVLSQARFVFRNRAFSATPKRTFGTSELSILETPWPNATTGDLITRMEWHAGLAGNAYVLRRQNRLRVLRPDWVIIVWGSEREPDDPALAVDAELVGYLYANGGFRNPETTPTTLTSADIAHWAPVPDPQCAGVGMSWITPAVREMQADKQATEHKLMYYANGATPNLVVKGIPATTKDDFDKLVNMMEDRHGGVRNAYRTLYLTAGADATVVGSNLLQLDLANSQGRGETRISVLSRVPASVLGISEGLQGSALNAGNFGQARRLFADTWVFPTLQDLAASLSSVMRVPYDAELWFDTSDMPILREDARDAAQITQVQASTIGQLVRDGFTPDSAKSAVISSDMSLLAPIPGFVSVQLQKANQGSNPGNGNAGGGNAAIGTPKPPVALPPGRDAGPKGERFDPREPRNPKGQWAKTGGVTVKPKTGAKRVSGASFHQNIVDARSSRRGAFLSLYTVNEYNKMRTYTMENGKVGGALKDHGDGRIEIVSLFNNGGSPGAGIKMLDNLIAEGGNYLECYGDRLKSLYASRGFAVKDNFTFDESLAAPDWNYERDGRPNYYTMSL